MHANSRRSSARRSGKHAVPSSPAPCTRCMSRLSARRGTVCLFLTSLAVACYLLAITGETALLTAGQPVTPTESVEAVRRSGAHYGSESVTVHSGDTHAGAHVTQSSSRPRRSPQHGVWSEHDFTPRDTGRFVRSATSPAAPGHGAYVDADQTANLRHPRVNSVDARSDVNDPHAGMTTYPRTHNAGTTMDTQTGAQGDVFAATGAGIAEDGEMRVDTLNNTSDTSVVSMKQDATDRTSDGTAATSRGMTFTISPPSRVYIGGVIMSVEPDSSTDGLLRQNCEPHVHVHGNGGTVNRLSDSKYRVTGPGVVVVTAQVNYTCSNTNHTIALSPRAVSYTIVEARDPVIRPESELHRGRPINITCVDPLNRLLPVHVTRTQTYPTPMQGAKQGQDVDAQKAAPDGATHLRSSAAQSTTHEHPLYVVCDTAGEYVASCMYTDDLNVNHTNIETKVNHDVYSTDLMFEPLCGTKLLASSLSMRVIHMTRVTDHYFPGLAASEEDTDASYNQESASSQNHTDTDDNLSDRSEISIRMEGGVMNGELVFLNHVEPYALYSVTKEAVNKSGLDFVEINTTQYHKYSYSLTPDLLLPQQEFKWDVGVLQLSAVLRPVITHPQNAVLYPMTCFYGLYVPGDRRIPYFVGRPTCARYRNDADQVGERCLVHVRSSLARCLYMGALSYGKTRVDARAVGPFVVLTVRGGASYEWQDDYFSRVRRCVNLQAAAQAENQQDGDEEQQAQHTRSRAGHTRVGQFNRKGGGHPSLRSNEQQNTSTSDLWSEDYQIDTTVPAFMLGPVPNEMEDKIELPVEWSSQTQERGSDGYKITDSPGPNDVRPSAVFAHQLAVVTNREWAGEDPLYQFWVRNTMNCQHIHILTRPSSTYTRRTDYNSPHLNVPHRRRRSVVNDSDPGDAESVYRVVLNYPGIYRACILLSSDILYSLMPSAKHPGQNAIRSFSKPLTQINIHTSRQVVEKSSVKSHARLESVLSNNHREPCGGLIDESQADDLLRFHIVTMPFASAYALDNNSMTGSISYEKGMRADSSRKWLKRLEDNISAMSTSSRIMRQGHAQEDNSNEEVTGIHVSINGQQWSRLEQATVHLLNLSMASSASDDGPRVIAVSASLNNPMSVSRTCVYYLPPPATSALTRSAVRRAATADETAAAARAHGVSSAWRYSFYRLPPASSQSRRSLAADAVSHNVNHTYEVVLTLHGPFDRSALVEATVAVMRMTNASTALSALRGEVVSNTTVSLTPLYHYDYARAASDNTVHITLPAHVRCQRVYAVNTESPNESVTPTAASANGGDMECVEELSTEHYLRVDAQINGQRHVQLSPVNVALSPLSLHMEECSQCGSGYCMNSHCVCVDAELKTVYECDTDQGTPIYMDGEDDVEIFKQNSASTVRGVVIALAVVSVVLVIIILGLVGFIWRRLCHQNGQANHKEVSANSHAQTV